jgi:uncharacterized membrane protein
MTVTADPPVRPRGPVRRTVRILVSRPNLTAAVLAGMCLWIALMLWPNPLRWSTKSILAWDFGSLWFIALMMNHMRECSVERMQAQVDRQDEGQGLILVLALVACVASLISVGVELNLAKADHGVFKGLRVALAAFTVAASWFTMQLFFALHYAHQFYEDDDDDPGQRGIAGGLGFPGGGYPDYWDFLHFSVVIGAAAQTADITFTSKTMRRIGTMHSLLAFTFNTVVLAFTINLLASLL